MADHPNAELLRRGYAAFSAGDMDTVSSLFAEDITWHNPGNNPLSGDYVGKEAVFGFFGKLMELTGGTTRLEVHDVVANDEHGVGLVQNHSERGGRTLDTRAVHVWHMRDGKATEFWNFVEDAAAVDEFFNS